MTTSSVPDTSNRGCPSMAAGTPCGRGASRISPSARQRAIRCGTDRSGEPSASPISPSVSYGLQLRSPVQRTLTQPPPTPRTLLTACPPEPFSGLPVGGDRASLLPTVSAPNSSPKGNLSQNGRIAGPAGDPADRPLARPVRRARRDDVATISLRCGSDAAVLPTCISAMFAQRRGTCPDQPLLAHLPTTPPVRPISRWKHPRLAFLQLTQLPVRPHDIKTGPERAPGSCNDSTSTALTRAQGSPALMGLACRCLAATMTQRQDLPADARQPSLDGRAAVAR